MANIAATIEAIQALHTLESAVSGFLDSFHRTIEIEVQNGDVDDKGHTVAAGFAELRTCYNDIHTSDHDYWVVEDVPGKTIDMHPPTSKTPIAEGQGFLAALQSNKARGCYLALPVQTSRVWFECPKAYWQSSSWKNLKVPEAVTDAGFEYPGCFYPTFVIAGYNSTGGTHALAPLSLAMDYGPYTPNGVRASASSRLAEAMYGWVYEQSDALDYEESCELHMGFDTQTVTIAKFGQYSVITPKAIGLSGIDSGGTECFVDDAGNLCRPYAHAKASSPLNDSTLMSIQVTIQRS